MFDGSRSGQSHTNQATWVCGRRVKTISARYYRYHTAGFVKFCTKIDATCVHNATIFQMNKRCFVFTSKTGPQQAICGNLFDGTTGLIVKSPWISSFTYLKCHRTGRKTTKQNISFTKTIISIKDIMVMLPKRDWPYCNLGIYYRQWQCNKLLDNA